MGKTRWFRSFWAREKLPFRLTEANDSFRAGLERLGLAPDHFDKDQTS